jgi:hypothetical protein
VLLNLPHQAQSTTFGFESGGSVTTFFSKGLRPNFIKMGRKVLQEGQKATSAEVAEPRIIKQEKVAPGLRKT